MIIYSIFGYVEIVDFINDFNKELTTINGGDYEETKETKESDSSDDENQKTKLIDDIDSDNDIDSDIDSDFNDEELEKIAENIQKENLQSQMN